MKKQKFLISILVYLLPVLFWAQGVSNEVSKFRLDKEQKIDSLKSISFENIAEEIKRLRNISHIYHRLNLDSALAFSKKELLLASSVNDSNILAESRINYATLLDDKGDFRKAILVLTLNKDCHNLDDSLIVKTDMKMANSLFNVKSYDSCLELALSAVSGFEKLKDSTQAGHCYLLIGKVYSEALDNVKESIVQIKKAISLFQSKSTPQKHMVYALLLYGDECISDERLDLALEKYLEAKKVARKYNVFEYMPNVNWSLGKVHYYKKNYTQSIAYLEEALIGLKKMGRPLMRTYRFLGVNYLDMGNPQKALGYFKICDANETRLSPMINNKVNLEECYVALHDYKNAYKVSDRINILLDSFNRVDRRRSVATIKEKYENEKKQRKIEKLKIESERKERHIRDQRIIIWGIILLFLTLGSIVYIWFRARQKLKEGKANLEKANLKHRFLQTQLNPHFLFHALSSIEGYIYTNEKEAAANFLGNFSRLMRRILESSDTDFITLKEELETIQAYLKIQQLNYDFRFEYELNVEAGLDLDGLKLPPMLTQPYIENAILHGATQVENGKITIRYKLENEVLKIYIQDNGSGSSTGKHESSQLHRSMSLNIVEQRIRNINKAYSLDIKYRSSLDGDQGTEEGTEIVFEIPI